MIAIIDVNHSFHKSYFVFRNWNKDSDLTQPKPRGILMRKAVTDLMASINKLNHRPEDVYFCFDSHTWRKEFSKEYKAGRGAKEKGFHNIINELHEIMTEKGFKTFKIEGAESDDCIAFISKVLPEEHLIISADEDMHQLLDNNIHVWNNNLKKPIVFLCAENNTTFFTFDYEKRIVDPRISLFKKVMLGCTGDEVSPLVNKKGIGEKTIEKFCVKYPELLDFKSPLVLENDIKKEFKYERLDFQNKLQHNLRLICLDKKFLPESILEKLTDRIIQLVSEEPKYQYTIEEVLEKTIYFL